jgi:hypothetical protein
MNECAAQRGFLMFRDCGNAAAAECSNCGRPMCEEHLNGAQCLDCAGRGMSMGTGALIGVGVGATAAWAYGFRHHYYNSSGYRPIGLDAADPFYDDYDVRSFNAPARHVADLDDEREPGFGDS